MKHNCKLQHGQAKGYICQVEIDRTRYLSLKRSLNQASYQNEKHET
nr:MAG TPA: hypothetical protein [Caudoviricetes sp.]